MSTVDIDTWWRRLGSATLVGTARRPPPSVADVELGGAAPLVPRADAAPEVTALDAAAVGGALRRAGRLPSIGTVAVDAAPDDVVPEVPPRAAQLLELLLTQPPTDTAGTELLLRHWATTCRDRGYRVPHRLLPALLDRAMSSELRRLVSVVVGERGAWLAPQNPAWSWFPHATFGPLAREAPDVDPHAWALLGTDERASQLRAVREHDPAAGRDLLLSTWASDPAKDRRTLLEVLQVNLEPDDEDFLESALDDRAASVRDQAAQLLDGLPGSRRAARMAERLRPLLNEGGLLRRHLDVTLPDDPDASGRRDGLGKPPPGRSTRGWWLERIVAGAPYDVWGRPAERIAPRLRDREVLAGLSRATVARRDVNWARALLDLHLQPELLAVLPPEEREARVIDELGRTPPLGLPGLLATLPLSWSPQLSSAVVARLTRLKPEEIGQALERLVPRLVRCLHQDAVPALQRWRGQAQLTRGHDDQLGSLIQSRTLRHTISEAFQP